MACTKQIRGIQASLKWRVCAQRRKRKRLGSVIEEVNPSTVCMSAYNLHSNCKSWLKLNKEQDRQCRHKVHCDAFAKPLLPWNCNIVLSLHWWNTCCCQQCETLQHYHGNTTVVYSALFSNYRMFHSAVSSTVKSSCTASYIFVRF